MLHSMIADTHTHVAIFSIKSSSHSKFASSLTTHRALLHNLIRRNKDVAVHGSFFFRRVTFPHTLLPYLSSDYLLDSRLICPRSKSTNHIPFGNVTNKGRPRALMPDTQAEPSGYPFLLFLLSKQKTPHTTTFRDPGPSCILQGKGSGSIVCSTGEILGRKYKFSTCRTLSFSSSHPTNPILEYISDTSPLTCIRLRNKY
jgi:hypothetical protein